MRRRALDLDTWGPQTWRGRALLAATLLPGAVIIGSTLAGTPITGELDLCVMHQTTGLWCPFCGGTRATTALIRGDLSTASAYNPFALATEVVAVVVMLRWMLRRLRHRSAAFLSTSEITGYLVAAGLFFVIRNLPGMWLHMGPLLGPPG
ncbi:DUF2752 domain-containing protein [Actinomyces slackii]|uniref:Protein of uncharacterized function (DUF2752) n=2 Tax=Actinomyces slackii TaxID=52774 RepID=A0A3S4UP86_9ACTO|nr:Protein of uncharacterised function (DUF2752) [Actinomyces slackii]